MKTVTEFTVFHTAPTLCRGWQTDAGTVRVCAQCDAAGRSPREVRGQLGSCVATCDTCQDAQVEGFYSGLRGGVAPEIKGYTAPTPGAAEGRKARRDAVRAARRA